MYPILIYFLIFLLTIAAACAAYNFYQSRHSVSLPSPQKALSDKEAEDALNRDLAPFGFAYNARQDIFYSLNDCWQRDFGYCRLYDEACAPLAMIIDCEPVYFPYNGKDWLIEFWKGQYGLCTGAEIGVYHKESGDGSSLFQSASDEERMPMTFRLMKDGKTLIYRHALHWWLTAFLLGQYSEPEDLTMEIEITFPSLAMMQAFVNGLKEAGYDTMAISLNSFSVRFIYDTPKTSQPYSRTPLITATMQRHNRQNCELYQHLSENLTGTPARMAYLKAEFPSLYGKAIAVGRPRVLFDSYDKEEY